MPADNVRIADVTDANAILEALEGCEALLIGSSAKVATLEFDTGVIDPATGRPKLGFPKGQPYDVDWLGQRNQIDAAKTCGCNHVVICSSMGGTDENHMLNGLGRDENDPATKGNILQWKRKAERYLIDSGLTYTIIHPGGLVDKPGGCRELVVGVDDVMVDGGVEINQCVGCIRQFFTKSFLVDGAAVLARSSGGELASPRHRAGVASMA